MFKIQLSQKWKSVTYALLPVWSSYIYIYIYICVAPRNRGEDTNVVLLDSLRSLYCHKPELSSLISKKVVYNYLNFKSVENICSGINIKGTVTSSIWTIKGGIFIWSVVGRNIFMDLICLLGGVCENLISKKNTNPPLLDRLKMDFRQPF